MSPIYDITEQALDDLYRLLDRVASYDREAARLAVRATDALADATSSASSPEAEMALSVGPARTARRLS